MERGLHRSPRGMRDVLPDEVGRWRRLEEIAGGLARLRGFREIRPTLIEESELFVRSVGEVTDIVEKEMFTIQKEGTSLSLRPEGTAGIARAYLQAGWAHSQPVQKLYHVGPMFRYERPQKGRERMFTQFDVEALGSMDPRLDAEVIALAVAFFRELGFDAQGEKGLTVALNSMGDGQDRDRYRDALRAFLQPNLSRHCALCQSRFERNVLRILDCKNPDCRSLLRGAPQMLGFLSPENREHFEEVEDCLAGLGIVCGRNGDLVRGLDYYTRTVFEIHYHPLGARSAVCGGGRYDHLLRDLGGPDLGAVGFAIGFTPTLLAMEELGLLSELPRDASTVYIVAAGEDQDVRRAVFWLAEDLRRAEPPISAVFDTERRSVKAQMKAADKGAQRFALVVGEDELGEAERGGLKQAKVARRVQLKNLSTGEQWEVAREELVERLQDLLAPVAGRS